MVTLHASSLKSHYLPDFRENSAKNYSLYYLFCAFFALFSRKLTVYQDPSVGLKRVRKRKRWFFMLLFCFFYTIADASILQSVAIESKGENFLIHFRLDKPTPHKVFTLKNPIRLVVDFENTTRKCDLSHLKSKHDSILRVRSGHPKPQTLRLVFEMQTNVRFQSLPTLTKAKSNIFSLKVLKEVSSRHITPKAKIKSKPVLKRIPLKPKRLTDVIVVIDPGHGGKDSGAVGKHRTYEKYVTLNIARKLKTAIDKTPGMRAILTRNSDTYIGLRERLAIARKRKAHIFVSIHADAFIHTRSHGASVFALSQRGATSEAARWLAEKENYSELGGVNLRDLDDQNGLVRSVLIDLSQTATIHASLNLGDTVLRELKSVTTLHHQKVEQARFMVLKSPDIPSILIETGFISNPYEERLLKDQKYEARLTEAIRRGIVRYFSTYPPNGTYLGALRNALHYEVRSGDLLEKIAVSYKVSIPELRQLNPHLNVSHRLTPGKILLIPRTFA